MLAAIHQEVILKAKPKLVYDALTDAAQFSKMTGDAPATITREAGGAFSCFGGMIQGRTVELIPNQRIVQAWRPKTWDAGIYSIVRFELKEEGSGTRLIFDHTGFPEDQGDHLAAGWKSNYWEPLERYLS
jgi:uncharacterized protein YndB with AHSA1/START domain